MVNGILKIFLWVFKDYQLMIYLKMEINHSFLKVLIFNGELYNHIYLRYILEKKGYKFKSSCDTEVFLFSN